MACHESCDHIHGVHNCSNESIGITSHETGMLRGINCAYHPVHLTSAYHPAFWTNNSSHGFTDRMAAITERWSRRDAIVELWKAFFRLFWFEQDATRCRNKRQEFNNVTKLIIDAPNIRQMMVEVHKLWISLGELVSRKVSISSGCFQQHFSKTPELLAGASWLSWTSKPSNKNKSENPIRIGQPNSKQIRALISFNDNLLPGTEWKLKIDRLERLWGHLVNRFCSILSNETKLAG